MDKKKTINQVKDLSSYGTEETSYLPRVIWILIHLVLVTLAAWLYFGNGFNWLGSLFGANWQPGDPLRREILFLCAVLLWLRMSYMALFILKRKFGWSEAVPVTLATMLYQLGFALAGAGQTAMLGLFDILGIFLVLVGSFLNTGSELARKKFKENPANKGKLYTAGIFRYSQHPNYLGDVSWATGWAILTGTWWAILIPVLLLLSFIFYLIPALNGYLLDHYGQQFENWDKTTKKLIPFIY